MQRKPYVFTAEEIQAKSENLFFHDPDNFISMQGLPPLCFMPVSTSHSFAYDFKRGKINRLVVLGVEIDKSKGESVELLQEEFKAIFNSQGKSNEEALSAFNLVNQTHQQLVTSVGYGAVQRSLNAVNERRAKPNSQGDTFSYKAGHGDNNEFMITVGYAEKKDSKENKEVLQVESMANEDIILNASSENRTEVRLKSYPLLAKFKGSTRIVTRTVPVKETDYKKILEKRKLELDKAINKAKRHEQRALASKKINLEAMINQHGQALAHITAIETTNSIIAKTIMKKDFPSLKIATNEDVELSRDASEVLLEEKEVALLAQNPFMLLEEKKQYHPLYADQLFAAQGELFYEKYKANNGDLESLAIASYLWAQIKDPKNLNAANNLLIGHFMLQQQRKLPKENPLIFLMDPQQRKYKMLQHLGIAAGFENKSDQEQKMDETNQQAKNLIREAFGDTAIPESVQTAWDNLISTAHKSKDQLQAEWQEQVDALEKQNKAQKDKQIFIMNKNVLEPLFIYLVNNKKFGNPADKIFQLFQNLCKIKRELYKENTLDSAVQIYYLKQMQSVISPFLKIVAPNSNLQLLLKDMCLCLHNEIPDLHHELTKAVKDLKAHATKIESKELIKFCGSMEYQITQAFDAKTDDIRDKMAYAEFMLKEIEHLSTVLAPKTASNNLLADTNSFETLKLLNILGRHTAVFHRLLTAELEIVSKQKRKI